jgi:signal transduction histidine kinase
MYLAIAMLVAVESTAACLAGIRARRAIGAGWTWCEVTGICAILLATPAWVPLEYRIGSWIGFAPGLALGVLSLAGAALIRSARHGHLQLVVAAVMVTGCYLAATLPAAHAELYTTVVGNALTYPTFCLLLALVTAYLRRMATDADTARTAAAAAAELAERRRNQLLLHDSASILQLRADERTLPELVTALRRQAASESARIRQFLQDPVARPVTAEPQTLAQAATAAAAGFADLPIDFVTDLGGSVPLCAARSNAVQGAITALLHNVRLHASARSVVIHTDVDATSGRWELSIRDDGCGYDMSSRPPGFGLSVQVHHALAEHQVEAHIQSEPGEGTVAVLRGAPD